MPVVTHVLNTHARHTSWLGCPGQRQLPHSQAHSCAVWHVCIPGRHKQHVRNQHTQALIAPWAAGTAVVAQWCQQSSRKSVRAAARQAARWACLSVRMLDRGRRAIVRQVCCTCRDGCLQAQRATQGLCDSQIPDTNAPPPRCAHPA